VQQNASNLFNTFPVCKSSHDRLMSAKGEKVKAFSIVTINRILLFLLVRRWLAATNQGCVHLLGNCVRRWLAAANQGCVHLLGNCIPIRYNSIAMSRYMRLLKITIIVNADQQTKDGQQITYLLQYFMQQINEGIEQCFQLCSVSTS
jgi:hypothetical protein